MTALTQYGLPLLRSMREFCDEQIDRPTIGTSDLARALKSQIESVLSYAAEDERDGNS